MVSDSWNSPVHGSPDVIFTYKMKRLKVVMKEWNLRVFGNIRSRLKQDQLRFETAARNSNEDLSNIIKLNAMKEAIIRIRRSNNTISEFVDADGDTISEYDHLRNHVAQYYEDKFNGQELDFDENLFDFEHPNGFSGCFYRHCWDIIQDDLIKAIIYCWNSGHIPNGVNSSLIILLAKVRGANTLRNFRPIGLSNFFFKIFTKILATRLSSVLDKLVSEEQIAFMKGRNIHENISLASEMVNELHIKRKDGNIGLKLDISQAFDTMNWSFVLEVFRRYGFSERWCRWLLDILSSARISILLNSNPEGYFKINRGLRQGDPLSPLIFVLIEVVLSRNITKLFRDKKMTPMVIRNGICPTHIFFADDIMIFCKGNLKSVNNLIDLLGNYQDALGQTVCRQKSKIYYGGGSLSRRTYLADFLGMSVATFPDHYLGVKIMPGTVRYHHICNMIKKIKAQLAGWKGRLLSFHDRIVLVKSVIASYSIHNMTVYKWPRKFILQCEREIRNFIWSGDSNISRVVVVAFDKTFSMIIHWIKQLWLVIFGMASNWDFLVVHMKRLVAAGVDIAHLPIPNGGEDSRIWMSYFKGEFNVSSSKDLIRQRYPTLEGASLIWRKEIHPVLAAQNWKVLRRACATYDLLQERFKIQLANKCCLCGNDEETLDHVLFECSFAARAWNWIAGIFGL
ncbi:uncharacterized protein LOC113342053 [Papaver somniferum]|uniref:uncharacterized protein LOC113342053 n=1 Tax=Papaver somniferum TaxID=3469 RepID=UPI000E6FA635|nr:uncharacterized protein LOC113342053 [Papaver somniferum]